MSELTRLRELAALLRPKPVNEAKGPPNIHDVAASVEETFTAFTQAINDLKYDLEGHGDLDKAVEALGMTAKARPNLRAIEKLVKNFEEEFRVAKKAIMQQVIDIEGMAAEITMGKE